MRRWDSLGPFGTVGDCFNNAAIGVRSRARMRVELLNTRSWATMIELAAALAVTSITSTTSNAVTATSVTSAPPEFETFSTSASSIPQLA